MERIGEVKRLVRQAEEQIRSEHCNWATTLCLLVEDLKECLGMNDFRGFVKEWDNTGNQVMREVTR